MNWEEREKIPKQKELIRYATAGLPDEQWENLQEKVFQIIEKVSEKIASAMSFEPGSTQKTQQVSKDIAQITLKWAQAKLEKPSLENEKLKAEIAAKFAETKKSIAETERTEEETRSLRIDNANKELSYLIDNLEKLLYLTRLIKGGQIKFTRVGSDGHLTIGYDPDELSNPKMKDKSE